MTGGSLGLPQPFVQNVLDVRGPEAGRAFLDRLPIVIEERCAAWGVTLTERFSNLTYNWAAPGTDADGRAVVLKIGFPADRALWNEIEALRVFDGRGAVRLVAADARSGALLLERAEPGTMLKALEDDARATLAAARVMAQLWHPAPAVHAFPIVRDWAKGFDRLRGRYGGRTGPMPTGWVERAEETYRVLLADPHEQVVLHGDLHHGNVLRARREPWLAIDPKGLVGEREYEPGALLRNPPGLIDDPRAGSMLARRLDILSQELSLDRDRVREWAIAQAVLSAAWTLEDHGEVGRPALACARLLAHA